MRFTTIKQLSYGYQVGLFQNGGLNYGKEKSYSSYNIIGIDGSYILRMWKCRGG